MKRDIDYALVEETRPEVYAAMKYWGKKPHNIWREYISCYTPEGGLFLDPFAGSAISAFEAVKAGRKAVAFDLNPLTSFFIDVLTSDYTEEKFRIGSEKIIKKIINDPIYCNHYYTKCEKCGNDKAKIVAYKWIGKTIYEVAIQCDNHTGRNGYRYTRKPTGHEIELIKSLDSIAINTWIPDDEFRDTSSFSANFVRSIGGKQFTNLWTRRNLYILSKIFSLIQLEKDENVKKQLMYSFVQTLHLTTKMCVPRRPAANRDFSTSWGRSAYLIAERQMEMNPLHVFSGNCFGKQSTDSSLKNLHEYIGKKEIKSLYIDNSNKSNRSNNFDIKYGPIDVLTLTEYIEPKSIDFIITDPPYGGLVQYLDLSTIWLIWLKKYNKKYTPHYDSEITVNNKNSIKLYEQKFTKALKNMNTVLKDDGKIVFTFHNSQLEIWNSFLNSITMAGFKIEKVIHQQNRRTGESNVANPYGTSATDFYIRCVKSKVIKLNNDKEEFESFLLNTTIKIIAERNEPTPYQILFNGLLAKLSSAGFNIDDFDDNVEKFLKRHLSDILEIISNNDTKAGDYWWFKNPKLYISQPDMPLTSRVEESIVNLLRRKQVVSYDEALAEVFMQFPNGLTPTITSIAGILKKYANKSGTKWVYAGGDIEKEFTKHTEMIKILSDIGKKMGYKIFIGRREQPENYKGKKLREFADYDNLSMFKDDFKPNAIKRLEMIDSLWVQDGRIVAAIEVENSTNFTSGIQRASNLYKDIPKIMVIPDRREPEIQGIKDPLFIESFNDNGWLYIKYSDIERYSHLRNPGIYDLLKLGKGKSV